MTKDKVFDYESEENIASLETQDRDMLLKKISDTESIEMQDSGLLFKKISDTANLEEILSLVRKPSYSKIKEEAADKLFEKAIKNIENQQYHEAISKLRKLISVGEKEAKYHRYLGLASLKKGWITYAKEEFLKAVDYDPFDEFSIKKLEEIDATYKVSKQTNNSGEKNNSYLSKAKNFVKELFEF